MQVAEYQEKFVRIASQTSFRFLEEAEQHFLREQAMAYRFTLQELQQVSDMALDRLRWKEDSIAVIWPGQNVESEGGKDKKSMLANLRAQHELLKSETRSYARFGLGDKPQTQKPRLVTTVKSNLGLGRCPVASEKTRCCNLLTLDAVEKCGFDCSYCSIQSFYHGDKVVFDEGFVDKLKKLKLDPGQTWHIGTGQSSDSLMWGNHGGVLEALAEFADENPNVILELKTKSKNIGWLLENDYPRNIICTWSLNPQTIIDHEEHLTASLEQRILSAQKIADKGRLTGFHFHPIVRYQGWEQAYRDICNTLVDKFTPNQVALVSMGTLTFTRSVMKSIRKRPFSSKILQMPMEEIAGKFSYPLALKIEMFKTIFDSLDHWHSQVFFYLCMEAQSLWQPVFGYQYETNSALEIAMKSAYLTKVEGLSRG